MNRVKGKLLKKLKSVKSIGYLNKDRVLQVNSAYEFVDNFVKVTSLKAQQQLKCNEAKHDNNNDEKRHVTEEQIDIVDVNELMRHIEDEEIEFADENDDVMDDKENIQPNVDLQEHSEFKENSENLMRSEFAEAKCRVSGVGDRRQTPLSEIDISSFRRPDFDSGELFDPNLIAAFRQAVEQFMRICEAERKVRIPKDDMAMSGEEEEEEAEPPSKAPRMEDDNLLLTFEEKCPPGGSESVVLYTTSLRGIRKTFEDCSSVRFLLDSFKIMYFERDISMHKEFREELWKTLGGKVLPPRLFIKGRYIGGAEIVLGLHERGQLRPMFEGIPVDQFDGPCDVCAGVRFLLCYKCSGSHKVASDYGLWSQCEVCNENGLMICLYCS